MNLRLKLALGAVLVFICCVLHAEKISDIHPQGYVTDLAQVIEPATKVKIEALCTEVQQKTGAQIAVVTVRSLDGRSREDYAADLYKQLGVGSKKDSTGVLLLLAPQERQYKIEVGYGLEPIINDARAGDVGRAMVPDLKSGNYSGAVMSGVTLAGAIYRSRQRSAAYRCAEFAGQASTGLGKRSAVVADRAALLRNSLADSRYQLAEAAVPGPVLVDAVAEFRP